MRSRHRPWLTGLVAAALVLGVTLRAQVPARLIHASTDPVIVAAGDIACGVQSTGSCFQNRTASTVAAIIAAGNPTAVLPLGDEQYECGVLSDWFISKGYDQSWGTAAPKDITYPAPGNHEYDTTTIPNKPCYNLPKGAPDYFKYFGSAASPPNGPCSDCGYYSFDLGAWHLIALNGNCGYVFCKAGSPQEQWLKADLAAHPNTCTLAYWHQPRWSSAGSYNNGFGLVAYDAFWRDLYAARADVVLNAHDHDYERFLPQTPDRTLDMANGITEFVVGTGGRSLNGIPNLASNSAFRQASSPSLLN